MTVFIKLTLPDSDTALLRGAANMCNMSLEKFIVEAAEEKARKMRLLIPTVDRLGRKARSRIKNPITGTWTKRKRQTA